MFAIKPSGPKYAALAAAVESWIVSGRYGVGDRLPSERELAEAHAMTVMTARQALKVLQGKGLIRREQGRGTFVAAVRQPGARTRAIKPVALVGLDAASMSAASDINWQVRLRRYQGIVDAAFQAGLSVTSRVAFDPAAGAAALMKVFRAFSGLLLHEELLPASVIQALQEQGIPVVAMNCYREANCCSRVLVNSRLGAFRAVDHLLALGHRRIGYIGGDPVRPSMRERLEGFRDALAARAIGVEEPWMVAAPRGRPEDGAAAARILLAKPGGLTALFAASDYRALGVLESARAMGVTVPRDVAVVGYDDIQEAAVSLPPLTTVHNPLYESGRAAVRMLADLLEQGRPEQRVRVFSPELVIRESSGSRRAGG